MQLCCIIYRLPLLVTLCDFVFLTNPRGNIGDKYMSSINPTEKSTEEHLLSTNPTKEYLLSTNTTKEYLLSTNTTKEYLLSTNTTEEYLLSTNPTEEYLLSTKSINKIIMEYVSSPNAREKIASQTSYESIRHQESVDTRISEYKQDWTNSNFHSTEDSKEPFKYYQIFSKDSRFSTKPYKRVNHYESSSMQPSERFTTIIIPFACSKDGT